MYLGNQRNPLSDYQIDGFCPTYYKALDSHSMN